MSRGHQIQFFMLREDEEAFLAWVTGRTALSLIRWRWYPTREYEEYTDLASLFAQPVEEPHHRTSIWLLRNRSLTGGPIAMKRVSEKQPYYEIQFGRSPIVEFTRCVFSRGYLTIGRLGFVPVYEAEPDVFMEKDPALAKWYRSLRGWIRRNSVRASFDGVRPCTMLHILPAALKYHQEGGALGSFGDQVGAFQPVKKDLQPKRRR